MSVERVVASSVARAVVVPATVWWMVLVRDEVRVAQSSVRMPVCISVKQARVVVEIPSPRVQGMVLAV